MAPLAGARLHRKFQTGLTTSYPGHLKGISLATKRSERTSYIQVGICNGKGLEHVTQ